MDSSQWNSHRSVFFYLVRTSYSGRYSTECSVIKTRAVFMIDITLIYLLCSFVKFAQCTFMTAEMVNNTVNSKGTQFIFCWEMYSFNEMQWKRFTFHLMMEIFKVKEKPVQRKLVKFFESSTLAFSCSYGQKREIIPTARIFQV